jgi:hypothetical protein
MKTLELLETYPIAGEIIKEHYKKVMTGGNELPQEIVEYLTEDVVTRGVSTMLDTNPRALLDLLDEHGIYATVVISYNVTNNNPVFGVDIDGAESETRFDTRHDAEVYLLENAMQMLNNKIS